jgi:eukaryotic-like serine/threonine-protein kinase
VNEPRTLGSRYRLEGAVGRGGMGIVHRARDLQLDRLVAIKLVADEGGSTARERFLTEARRTAGVRHPSIVEVFDVGEDGGDAFLVMELLEGETVDERVSREGRIEPAVAVAIASEVCDALSAAHDAGLVHRDLKPANVFLVRAGSSGEGLGGQPTPHVKLLDFGIAKRIDGATARTDPNMIVGTFEYMAPEQIRGGRIDARADLYALGMTLYCMLTGAPAFAGENIAALVHQHLDVAPTSVRERAPAGTIPAWLDALVLRLLAKDPEARPASARDVKAALASATEGPKAPHVASPSSSPSPASSPSHAREGMRMLDDDDSAGETAPLELDLPDAPVLPPHLGEAPPQHPIARVPQRLPAEVPAAPLAVVSPPLPAWLEPLGNVPVALSKRVLGYSLFVFLLNVVFFHGSFVASLVILTVAAIGGVAMWAGSRLQR